MNTTNTPDRDEVKERLKELQFLIEGSKDCAENHRLHSNELTVYLPAISSALTLLEQDKEDGKRLDWMESTETTGFERWSTGWGLNDHSFETLRDAIDSEMTRKESSV